MTTSEFNVWYAHHRGYYPGLDKWLDSLGEDDLGGSIKVATLRLWRNEFNALELSVKDVIEASTQLYRSPEQPGYDRHCWRLCQIGKRVKDWRRPKPKPAADDDDGPWATEADWQRLREAMQGIGQIPDDETEDETRMRLARARSNQLREVKEKLRALPRTQPQKKRKPKPRPLRRDAEGFAIAADQPGTLGQQLQEINQGE